MLVVCTGNAARSQMAEAFINHDLGDRYQAVSAGTRPSDLHALTVEVMAELGLDVARQRSKGVEEFLGQAFDVVITVCDNAAQECPTWPNAGEKVHLAVDDPDSTIADFRRARDQVRRRVIGYLRSRP